MASVGHGQEVTQQPIWLCLCLGLSSKEPLGFISSRLQTAFYILHLGMVLAVDSSPWVLQQSGLFQSYHGTRGLAVQDGVS